MTNQPNEEQNPHKEPVSPTIGFMHTKTAGDTSGRTSDYAAWQQDMADRKARAAELEQKRQQHKPQDPRVELSAVDEVLNALSDAADDFEQTHLQPNIPLIETLNEVER